MLMRGTILSLLIAVSASTGSDQPRKSQTNPCSDLGRRRDTFSADAISAKHRALPLQPLVEKMEWKWSDAKASADYSTRSFEGAAKVAFDTGDRRALTIRFSSGGKEIISFPADTHTVFVGRGDIVYYGAFSDCLSGCKVVAYDLKMGRQLWVSTLWAIPITRESSQYYNRINMNISNEKLIVYGNEAYGKYIELLDLKTGKTTGHKAMPDARYYP